MELSETIANEFVYLKDDYNIDLLNSEKHDLTNDFVDVLHYNEFHPLISGPMRITSTSATRIDSAFTNNHGDLNCSLNGILVTNISDHLWFSISVAHFQWKKLYNV